jgi:hypothetical protein
MGAAELLVRLGQWLATACGSAWALFGVLCGWREGPVAMLLHAVPGLLILGAAALTLRWPVLGGLALLGEGYAATRFFRPNPAVTVFLVSPLFLSGAAVLLGTWLGSWRRP